MALERQGWDLGPEVALLVSKLQKLADKLLWFVA